MEDIDDDDDEDDQVADEINISNAHEVTTPNVKVRLNLICSNFKFRSVSD